MSSNLKELKAFCTEKVKKYPEIIHEIWDFYFLAHDEVCDGESETNECYLAEESINQLIAEYEADTDRDS